MLGRAPDDQRRMHPSIASRRTGNPSLRRMAARCFSSCRRILNRRRGAAIGRTLARQGFEAAFVAEVGGAPAGTCLFVEEEIEPRHDVSLGSLDCTLRRSFVRDRSVVSWFKPLKHTLARYTVPASISMPPIRWATMRLLVGRSWRDSTGTVSLSCS